MAAAIAREETGKNAAHCEDLRSRLWAGLQDIDGITRNGSAESTYAGILNISADGVDGESLMLGMQPVCVASGSACNSTSGESSYVLRALGRDDRLAQSAVRFSFGRPTTPAEVDFAVERYREAVARLRDIAPGRAA